MEITKEFIVKNRFVLILFLVIGYVSIGFISIGCLKLTKDFPEKKSYLIEVPLPKKNIGKISDVSFKLRKVSVSNKFEGKSFVYRKSDSNFESDFYNEFLVSPQSNIGEEIIRYLDNKELFHSVSGMNSRIEATHYFEADVVSLYGDYRDKKNSLAIISIQFRIFDDRMGEYKLVHRKSYNKQIKVNPDVPDSLVSGWNQGLFSIMDSFSQDLRTFNWEVGKK
jgi:cholesterol transport system auxiliary component